MPPALRRNKFATDARNASWHPAPASSVWDLRRLRAYAASELWHAAPGRKAQN